MSAVRLLRANADFRRLWLGEVLSQAGTRAYQIAILWWILSRDALAPGLAMGVFLVLGALPSLLFVRPIGRLIDRAPARRILVLADLAAAAVAAGVAGLHLAGRLSLPAVCAAGFALAWLQALIDPTLNKAVPEVTRPEELEPGVALVAATQSLANFAGAVLGALVIGAVGVLGAMLLNAASYLAAAGCAARARFTPRDAGAAEAGREEPAGLSLLDGKPLLRAILLCFGLINFFATPTFVVLPLYTKLMLGGDARMLGGLEAALWAGLILGTFASDRIAATRGTLRLGAACMLAFGLSLLLPGLIVSLPAYAAFLAAAGFALGLNNVKFVTLFHEIVEPAVKGRFFALMQALIGFSFPVAFLAFGLLGDRLLPSRLCLIQGAGILVIALAFLRLAAREGELRPSPAPRSEAVPA